MKTPSRWRETRTCGRLGASAATAARIAAGRPAAPATVRAAVSTDRRATRADAVCTVTRPSAVAVACAGTSGARALLGDGEFDMVVVDLMLSGDDDGWQALEVVRERAPDASTVIASVLDVSDYPPADSYLPKPFTRSQVQRLVDGLA